MPFQDREDAGRRMVPDLEEYRGRDVIVLALPRGGVVVGYQIAKALHWPLDVLIVRKIGAPGDPEFGIGAVAETGSVQVNNQILRLYGIPPGYVQQEAERQQEEIKRRQQIYRQGRPLPKLEGRTVLIVDDGIATGYTALAAVRTVWLEKPSEVVLVVPVSAPEAIEELRPEVTRLICGETPSPFFAVGAWYQDFDQVTDDQVREYLDDARQWTGHATA